MDGGDQWYANLKLDRLRALDLVVTASRYKLKQLRTDQMHECRLPGSYKVYRKVMIWQAQLAATSPPQSASCPQSGLSDAQGELWSLFALAAGAT